MPEGTFDLQLSIREAVADEAEAIAAVRQAAANDLTRRYGPGLWSSNTTANVVMLAMKHGRVIIATDADAIVGTLTLSKRKPWAIDKSCFTRVKTPIYLTNMAVDPRAQFKGVGRALLADAEVRTLNWPGGSGQAIRLDAFDATAGAGPFYAKCGYSHRGHIVFSNAPLIYFERLLAPDRVRERDGRWF
ncbi:MAG TPA: GNAT family N-acetyltransferase [Hyphomonadaceae bacterium]|jgi:GNAT superfamily N-acetyltransferase|nr:GNAT family N-acetyltransferase [Hyphomonadaceae bacterium]HPN05515.1 GNAT family N-acetyltransferase [Hyphomonadaceae bacterium]